MMRKYTVDVKAFFSIEVLADSKGAARHVADAFVDNVMTATHSTIEGYNSGLPEDTIGTIVPAEIAPCIDGMSDVELVEEDDDGE